MVVVDFYRNFGYLFTLSVKLINISSLFVNNLIFSDIIAAGRASRISESPPEREGAMSRASQTAGISPRA